MEENKKSENTARGGKKKEGEKGRHPPVGKSDKREGKKRRGRGSVEPRDSARDNKAAWREGTGRKEKSKKGGAF